MRSASDVKYREIYTTSQVARITHTSPGTVTKWIEQGYLKGFRVPSSTHLRIPHGNLENFMRDAGMPEEWIPTAPEKAA